MTEDKTLRIFRNKVKRITFQPNREAAKGDKASEYEIYGFVFFTKYY
jgi:hypothetical protein